MKNQTSSSVAEHVMNSKSKFTSGPWKARIDPYPEEETKHWIDGPTGEPIANVFPYGTWDYGETGRANARLIASAPDLLEACKAVIEEYDKAGGLMSQAIPKVRQAIRSAEGREER